jgi:hypothetical protein
MRFTAIPRMSAALRFWVSWAGMEAKSPQNALLLPTQTCYQTPESHLEELLRPKGNFIGLNRVYTRDER